MSNKLKLDEWIILQALESLLEQLDNDIALIDSTSLCKRFPRAIYHVQDKIKQVKQVDDDIRQGRISIVESRK
tara:strand:- start:254 stop:472 length:219 start_codon:yes stop_codon:yes gene_type:complete